MVISSQPVTSGSNTYSGLGSQTCSPQLAQSGIWENSLTLKVIYQEASLQNHHRKREKDTEPMFGSVLSIFLVFFSFPFFPPVPHVRYGEADWDVPEGRHWSFFLWLFLRTPHSQPQDLVLVEVKLWKKMVPGFGSVPYQGAPTWIFSGLPASVLNSGS